jgi:hypothetical protein
MNTAPSFYAHLLSGMLILFSAVLVVMNYSKLLRLKPHKIIILSLFFSLVIGIHGLSHLSLERAYGFNSLKNYR